MKKTVAERKIQAQHIHGNKFDYSNWPTHVTNTTKVPIICPRGHFFTQTISAHIHQKQGCPICAGNNTRTDKQWIEEFIKIHNGKYKYTTPLNIINNVTPITIVCDTHGEFVQTPKIHIRGVGCPKCKGRHRTKEDWIKIAKKVHGDKYDYSLLPNVIKDKDIVTILCPDHGPFTQCWNNHIRNGATCRKCRKDYVPKKIIDVISNKTWLIEHHLIQQKPLTQIANELGISDTTVGRYLHNHGLDTQHFFTSTGERQITNFLQSLNVKTTLNTRKVIPPFELDIFLTDYNIAIEYCGLYWHSEQMGKHRLYHYNKWKRCAEHNIQLLTIFEDEWKNNQKAVESKIKNLLGKTTNSVFARKCTIKNISSRERKDFLNQYHVQRNGPGSISLGLFHRQELVACMTFINNRYGHFTLSRYASSVRVVGGFSKLLHHFTKTHTWSQIISFADLRWSDGNLYNKTDWKLDNILPPDYFYSITGSDRQHKFKFRRKHLPRLLNQFDPNLSERANCDTNHILRIWDCGKLKFTFTNNSLKIST